MAALPGEAGQILQQQLALDVYLQNLLQEMPVDAAQEDNRQAADTALDVAMEPIVRDSSAPTRTQPDIRPPASGALPSVVERNRALAIMPDWAQQEFLALFFRVGKLLLATPLSELQHTRKMPGKLGHIPGQPPWFLGLMEDQGRQIGVLDCRQLFFGRPCAAQAQGLHQPFTRVLVVHGKKWALACDEVLSIARLPPERVRWRTMRQTRPWLIGTLTEELVAVVDIGQLLQQIRIN